ncbi:MAG: DUF5320 domain-containing protein [Desulfotignum sp.]|nr:DUF5320 domain-containing protein [Desulfotignum sp.]
MPGFNRRGPDNQGPMTGGGRGFCTGVADLFRPVGAGYGRGRGRGRGQSFFGGRGFGRMGQGPTVYETRDDLQMRAKWLETELAAVKEQLEE